MLFAALLLLSSILVYIVPSYWRAQRRIQVETVRLETAAVTEYSTGVLQLGWTSTVALWIHGINPGNRDGPVRPSFHERSLSACDSVNPWIKYDSFHEFACLHCLECPQTSFCSLGDDFTNWIGIEDYTFRTHFQMWAFESTVALCSVGSAALAGALFLIDGRRHLGFSDNPDSPLLHVAQL